VTGRATVSVGWQVDDLGVDDELRAVREFDSLEDAVARATADFPPGTTVGWSTPGFLVAGGFVVGYPDAAPPMSGVAPAFVLWPDGTQGYAQTAERLASLVRGRAGWLCDLALASGFASAEVEHGREAMEDALDRLEAGDGLARQCRGPIDDVRCAVGIEPAGRLRWTGFQEGWNEPDGPPPGERRHPVHDAYAGEFQHAWREAVAEGINARRKFRR
jgi:hypothetical protein